MSAGVGLKWGIGAAVVALAGAGYWFTGTPNYEMAAAQALAKEQALVQAQVQAQTQAQAASAPALPDPAQLDAMMAKLEARLATQPDDLQGWTMLARAHMLMGRAPEASKAYAKAVALKGDDPRLLADWAEAMGMSQGNKLAGEPTALINKALAIDPAHPKALALAGAAAFDRQDFAAAIGHWEKLLAASAPDAEFVAQLKDGINQARAQGKLPATVPTPAASSAAKASPTFHVSGTVNVDAKLASQIQPDDTLFIFARAVNGPRMPLLILRKQARDLPLRFTLNETMAMAGTADALKGVQQVVIGARISRSGQALPQPGDLSGVSEPVAVGATDVALSINTVVPKP